MPWDFKKESMVTRTECRCAVPLVMDERAVALGIRCFWCGLSLEHRISLSQLKTMLETTKSADEAKELETSVEEAPA